MNEKRDERKWCCFHPREMVVGVCAMCLNERLLVVASNQAHLQQTHSTFSFTPKWALPKIFALTTLLNRLDIKQHKSEVYDTSSTSPEESFISIKFEENGVGSWDKGKISKMSHDDIHQCEMSSKQSNWDKAKKSNTIVEHAKPRPTLRWRRRIGHLFHLIKWKRSTKESVCHVGTKLERAKAKYGWIRTLTKRRTKEERP